MAFDPDGHHVWVDFDVDRNPLSFLRNSCRVPGSRAGRGRTFLPLYEMVPGRLVDIDQHHRGHFGAVFSYSRMKSLETNMERWDQHHRLCIAWKLRKFWATRRGADLRGPLGGPLLPLQRPYRVFHMTDNGTASLRYPTRPLPLKDVL
jgi:hypothetical protein